MIDKSYFSEGNDKSFHPTDNNKNSQNNITLDAVIYYHSIAFYVISISNPTEKIRKRWGDKQQKNNVNYKNASKIVCSPYVNRYIQMKMILTTILPQILIYDVGIHSKNSRQIHK